MSKSSAFLKSAQEKLIYRKQELSQQLSAGVEVKSEKQVKDLGDEAQTSSMDKLQSSLEQAEIDEINLIDAALTRIDRGDYGECVDCEEAISERRLEYSPYAARCIPCQEELENQSEL